MFCALNDVVIVLCVNCAVSGIGGLDGALLYGMIYVKL